MRLAVACFAALLIAAPVSAEVLYDTGAPHIVLDGTGAQTYLGWSSGDLGAGMEQRWTVEAFRIPTGGAVIEQIDVDWFVQAGQEADNVRYIIWQRNGLTAPVQGNQFSEGLLGVYGPGIDDPRITGVDEYLHQYQVNIPIPAGDYWLTIYGDGGTAPNNTPWMTGADLQDPALQQAFLWRSAQFPTPGFEQYTTSAFTPGPGMSIEDFYTKSFTLHGRFVPEPASLGLLALGLLALRRR